MSQFYARYVPPSSNNTRTVTSVADTSKRKRNVPPGKPSEHPKSKRTKIEDSRGPEDYDPANQPTSKLGDSSGKNVLKKYSLTKFTQEHGNQSSEGDGKKPLKREPNGVSHKEAGRVAKNVRQQAQDGGGYPDSDNTAQEQSQTSKHFGIISRFERSKIWSAAHKDQSGINVDVETEEKSVTYGLQPIPQPQLVATPLHNPTYSTIPIWQSKAQAVDKTKLQTFSDLGLSQTMIANLEKHGITQAFPVQSTLIPLLFGNQKNAAVDICVSAATGSGKTLSYVVPIIENLRKSRHRSLRAVIIVPTRELVQQVKETCEICAAGSGLRIVTAVGNKSIIDEQALLISEEDVYDPARYKEEQNTPLDWSSFDLIAEVERARSATTGPPSQFVTQRTIKADVLITTPGRLVDHLKHTDGFHLDDIEWLVVDEADRLLNESYQEWVELLVPALQSRGATKQRDDILRSMRMDLPARHVRKILLSATMTRDISKLNALGLHKPKLIVLDSDIQASNAQASTDAVQHAHEEVGVDDGQNYHIPASLSESVVAFKNGADKPLILLQLLRKLTRHVTNRSSAITDDETSSSGSDSDAEDDTSSSDTDSETHEGTSESSTAVSSESEASSSDDGSGSDSEKSTDLPEQTGGPHKPNHSQAQKAQTSPRALVFTKSTSSASRLMRLLSLLSPDLAVDMATLTRSTISSASSRRALSAIRTCKIHILICTDRASRGIDVPGLENVINYDIPARALTYVHRVGRTARAGVTGHSWTLLEHRQGRWFWNEIGGKRDACKIKRCAKMTKIESEVEDEALRIRYEHALRRLGEEVRS